MREPPTKDAARAATRAVSTIKSTSPDSRTAAATRHVEPDTTIVYALASMHRHHAAAERARLLGLELFPAGPARAIASLILTGKRTLLNALDSAARREADELGRAVIRCTVPGEDAAWAAYLVGLLARDRHLPLLVQTFRWAADRARAGVPLRHLRRCVGRAFDIAEGQDDAASAILLDDGLEVAA